MIFTSLTTENIYKNYRYTGEVVDVIASKVDGAEERKTRKILLQWPDSTTSECCLIPSPVNRYVVGVASQVGCKVTCRFCASGIGPWQRNLTAEEMVEQIIRVDETIPYNGHITNVSFMSVGEPMDNIKEIIRCIQIVLRDFVIPAKKILVSTVGVPDAIIKIADAQLGNHVIWSMHAPNDDIRHKIIPWGIRYKMDDIADALNYFKEKNGHYDMPWAQYILIDGITSEPEHIEELIDRLYRYKIRTIMIIEYNNIDIGDPDPNRKPVGFRRPEISRTHEIIQLLRNNNFRVLVRESRAHDIDGACGQMRQMRVKEQVTLKQNYRLPLIVSTHCRRTAVRVPQATSART